MISMILPSMIILSALFFWVSTYFKTLINPRVMSDNLFYTSLHLVFFNLFIISLPMMINLAWVGANALNYHAVNDTSYINGTYTELETVGVYDNLITLFESFSILAWFAYSVYIGMFIITYCIKLIENIRNKRGQ